MSTLIVGGGITGLAAAAFLLEAGHEVTVLEAGPPGGMIQTTRQDGFVIEQGAESIRGGAPAVGRLLDLLGLRSRVVLASPKASSRFLLRQGALHPMPQGLLGALRTPLWRRRAVVRALLEPMAGRGPLPPMSVATFARRRLGPLADLTNPLMAGIFAGDPERLDAETALSRPWEWVQQHGSIVLGAMRAPPATDPKGSFTFVTGMAELVEALVARVGDNLRVARVESLTRSSEGFRAETTAGPFQADRVFVTCSPEEALRMSPELQLPVVPRAPVAAVHVAFHDRDIPGPTGADVRGFGWLCHERERRDVLGVLWVSSTFPSHAPQGQTLFRLMCGGTRAPELVGRSDEELITHTCAVLRDTQGIRATPSFTHVQRVVPGIPQYPVGWGREMAALRRGGQGHGQRSEISYAGWYWSGIGIADGLTAAYFFSER
jgi:protoporphyrinogen/coproporphyrinogen III oxidase